MRSPLQRSFLPLFLLVWVGAGHSRYSDYCGDWPHGPVTPSRAVGTHCVEVATLLMISSPTHQHREAGFGDWCLGIWVFEVSRKEADCLSGMSFQRLSSPSEGWEDGRQSLGDPAEPVPPF